MGPHTPFHTHSLVVLALPQRLKHQQMGSHSPSLDLVGLVRVALLSAGGAMAAIHMQLRHHSRFRHITLLSLQSGQWLHQLHQPLQQQWQVMVKQQSLSELHQPVVAELPQRTRLPQVQAALLVPSRHQPLRALLLDLQMELLTHLLLLLITQRDLLLHLLHLHQ